MRKLKLKELNRLSIEEYKKTDKKDIVAILDNIRSAHNVGSIFRSSDALAIKKMYLCGFTPTPPSKEIRKTAIGATLSVQWEYVEKAKTIAIQLKDQGYLIVGVEQTDSSIPLHEFSIPNIPMALIFGNEVNGIDDQLLQLCDCAIEIHQYGTKHSLNVAVCYGIVMYQMTNYYQ